MITSHAQAMRVQLDRMNSGKTGHSHAVRRFLKRGLDLNELGDYNCYLRMKMTMTHRPLRIVDVNVGNIDLSRSECIRRMAKLLPLINRGR